MKIIGNKYNSNKLRWFFVCLFLFAIINFTYAQKTKQKLQADKAKIEREIKYTNKLLRETQKSKKASINKLYLLNNQIKKRERLIKNINKETVLVNKRINVNNDSIQVLRKKLELLKKEYAKILYYYAYKNGDLYNRLIFIFSSEDFNQAFQRIKYFQQYSKYRKKQAESIKRTEEEIYARNRALKKQKQRKIELITQKKHEKDKFLKKKHEKNILVQKLNKKERRLLKDLREKEKASKHLQDELARIISNEIKKSFKETKKVEKSKSDFALTPEEAVLSKNFYLNKGKLPWPTERGIVSSTFGKHRHQVLKHVKIQNNGIDILTEKGSKARAIFSGKVTTVMTIPHYNNVVIIRHGDYLSVYSNLKDVFVKKGQKINTKQNIGTVYTNNDDYKTELHFEIWKGKIHLNPAIWLKKKT